MADTYKGGQWWHTIQPLRPMQQPYRHATAIAHATCVRTRGKMVSFAPTTEATASAGKRAEAIAISVHPPFRFSVEGTAKKPTSSAPLTAPAPRPC